MLKLILNADLTKIPALLFFLVLMLFPFLSYAIYTVTGMEPNFVLGFVCFLLFAYLILRIYKLGANLMMPNYLVIFGFFTVYTILSDIFIAKTFGQVDLVKYLYSNYFILSWVAFLIVENLTFNGKWIANAEKVLYVVIVLAAVVITVQVFDPLFLYKNNYMLEGVSFERMADYYTHNQNPNDQTGSTNRFLDGYRPSIYSYIDGISVGVDALATFSILLAFKTRKRIKVVILVIAAAVISILSSSRWIMLNFVVIASQNIWTGKNVLLRLLKYLLYAVVSIVVILVLLQLSGFDVQKFIDDRLLSDSASTRFLAFEVFGKVFHRSPILGTGGVDTLEVTRLLGGRSSQIHVGYLKLYYYYGIVGGTLFLGFLYALLYRLWKMAKISGYWGGFFAILAFAIANLTLVKFHMFYHGLLLALLFSNHFFSIKTDKTLATAHIDESVQNLGISNKIVTE